MAATVIEFGSYEDILKQVQRTSVLPAVYYNELPQELRRLAFTVSGIEKITSIQSVLDSLEKAEADGVAFTDWVEQFNIQDFAALSESRRETVYRTNMTTQYNNGRLQVGLSSDTLTFLKYQAVLDDRTRPNHAANDGITLPIDDPFWLTNTPPLGFNCRCIVLNLDAKDLPDNPLTPQSKLDDKILEPDPGFDGNVLEPEKDLTSLFKEDARSLPKELAVAATAYLLLKDDDQEAWWDENQEQFVKPK